NRAQVGAGRFSNGASPRGRAARFFMALNWAMTTIWPGPLERRHRHGDRQGKRAVEWNSEGRLGHDEGSERLLRSAVHVPVAVRRRQEGNESRGADRRRARGLLLDVSLR